MKTARILVRLLLLVLLTGCHVWPYRLYEARLGELPVVPIELDGEIATARAELSAMAWYGDTLLIVPQYPARFPGGSSGSIFMLTKAEIVDYLDGKSNAPLVPRLLPFFAEGVRGQFRSFEGYESIAVVGNTVYMTIEARQSFGMVGYIVRGTLAPDLSALTMDAGTLQEIPTQASIANRTDEAMTVAGERVLTFYESNGQAVNPTPVAHVFDLALNPLGTIPSPSLEYRITDATTVDEQGRFWVINSFFPVEAYAEGVSPDSLAETYGVGPSHAKSYVVERLVAMQVTDAGVDRVEQPPLYLELSEDGSARNWEGLVRLDQRGFLLATDRFPGTILAFVPYDSP